MRCVFVAAGIAACVASTLAGVANAGIGYDSIGGNNVTTNGSFWLTSTTNTDFGGDATTACAVAPIAVPAGERITEIVAVIGSRGPGGAGSIDFANITRWHVEFWSSEAAFAASPTIGDLRSLTYAAPTNADYTTPYGTDSSARPTFLVKFRLPGGITPPQAALSYFSVRASASRTTAMPTRSVL